MAKTEFGGVILPKHYGIRWHRKGHIVPQHRPDVALCQLDFRLYRPQPPRQPLDSEHPRDWLCPNCRRSMHDHGYRLGRWDE